jgi:hypothetical protein
MVITLQDAKQLVVQFLREIEKSLNMCFEAVVIGYQVSVLNRMPLIFKRIDF